MTHLPLCMLPPKLLNTCKVVTIARNPLDVLISYYNHHKNFSILGLTGELADFKRMFKANKTMYGNYWFHLQDALKYEQHPNMVFYWYEDFIADYRGSLKDLSEKLGFPLEGEGLERLTQRIDFKNFRQNKSLSPSAEFCRKGKANDWMNHFDDKEVEEWKEWVKQNRERYGLQKVDVKLPF